MIVLDVQNLTKSYYRYPNEWHRFKHWFGFLGKPVQFTQILKPIDFQIKSGESIAIVGVNGAGKSTLLKLITGTLKPTTGYIETHGRVAAILELGMGFNPDFTGRQNAQNALAMMGHSASDIEKVMPNLELFAEIGSYFDQPTRIYSSGMQMRVAFAVATAFQPDVLIIDEALSVGDMYFQHKSFAKIKEFKTQGTTLLLVSHDRSAIQSLCDRVLLLNQGEIILDAEPEAAMDYYNALIAEKEDHSINIKSSEDGVQTQSGNHKARFTHYRLCDHKLQEFEFKVGEELLLEVETEVYQNLENLVFGFMIKDRVGQAIYGTNTYFTQQILTDLKAGQRNKFIVRIPGNLGEGSFSITLALNDGETHLNDNYEWIDRAIVFKVTNTEKPIFVGSSWLPCDINITPK